MPDRAVLQIVCIDCGGPVEAGKNRCAAHLRHTPERAVVDDVPCAWCGGDGYVTGSMNCPECTTKPRAVVALSDDRQWLVTLEPEGWHSFMVWCREWESGVFATSGKWHWEGRRRIGDTGQSADDVLREWMDSQP